MYARRFRWDGGIGAHGWTRMPMALRVGTAILALAGAAASQTITYKTPNPRGRGWSDGTLGGGYAKPDPNFRVPRTPDGQPDLQGVWGHPTLGNQPTGALEAEPAVNVVTRVVDPPDGKIPYKPWARALRNKLDPYHTEVRYIDPQSACVPPGMPRMMYSRNVHILQTPGEVLILTETSSFRHIPLDHRPHIGKRLTLSTGDSRGRWEETSLVVDTTNMNDDYWLSVRGDFYSDQLRLKERLTPIASNIIQYEVTLEDPVVFESPWTMTFPLIRHRDPGYEFLEEYCAEGNQSAAMQLRAGRKLWTGLADARRESGF